jgi:hypothetical protein
MREIEFLRLKRARPIADFRFHDFAGLILSTAALAVIVLVLFLLPPAF